MKNKGYSKSYYLLLIFFSYFLVIISTSNTAVNAAPGDMPVLQIPIPNIHFSPSVKCTASGDEGKLCVNWIAEYIAGIYKYAIGIVGILATVVMMIGGVMWMMSGGNASTAGEAKSWITSSLTGLIIALSSYMILYQVNPALVLWGPLKIEKIIPLASEQNAYASMACPSDAEKTGGFKIQATAYCQPKTTSNYGENTAERKKFLCNIGLNCSCPSSRNSTNDCSNSKGFSWSSCNDFNDKTVAYCNATAGGGQPGAGQIAADWSCFNKNSSLCINGTNYTVTDKGGAIKGRRADIWVNNCNDAGAYTGTFDAKVGSCL